MAGNLLPLLLIGGGAYYFIKSQKNGNGNGNGKPFLWMSKDCSKVKMLGLPMEEANAKQGDAKFGARVKAEGNRWAAEELNIDEWFDKHPTGTSTELENLSVEMANWAFPQCKFSRDDMLKPGTVRYSVLTIIHSIVLLHSVAQHEG